MKDFQAPAYDDIDPDQPNIPSEGWHDATAISFQPSESSKEDPMMEVEYRIDNGEDKGLQIRDWFVFGRSSMIGERQLKKMCECADFRWEQKGNLPAFVAQFPEHELRVGLKVSWGYSIKKGDQWHNVSEEEYQDFDGEKNVNTNIEDYRAPAQPSELTGGDGAPTDETFEPMGEDEEIPF